MASGAQEQECRCQLSMKESTAGSENQIGGCTECYVCLLRFGLLEDSATTWDRL